MDIRNREDWWRSAQMTVPRLPHYAAEHQCKFDVERANSNLEKMDAMALWRQFEDLWGSLPDNPSIRHGAFFDLCDLCSEVWVFDEK